MSFSSALTILYALKLFRASYVELLAAVESVRIDVKGKMLCGEREYSRLRIDVSRKNALP